MLEVGELTIEDGRTVGARRGRWRARQVGGAAAGGVSSAGMTAA
jgi:hypothetical protein